MKQISDLHHKNIVIYDLEICQSPGSNGVTWKDFKKMGISVGSCFDYQTGDTSVYLTKDIWQLTARLLCADIIVGFNHIGFDNKLLKEITGAEIPEFKCFDLLRELRLSCGPFARGCKMSDVLEATLGMKKTGKGEDAPKLYQQGEISDLINYNLADVRRTRLLFEYAYINGYLITNAYGKHPMRNAIEEPKIEVKQMTLFSDDDVL